MVPPRGVAGPSLAQPGLALSGRPRSPLLSPPCLLQARDFLLEEQARGPRLISFPAEIPRAPGSKSQGAALARSTCVLPGPSSSMRWGHGEPPRGQVGAAVGSGLPAPGRPLSGSGLPAAV